jgi:hypothetical protein
MCMSGRVPVGALPLSFNGVGLHIPRLLLKHEAGVGAYPPEPLTRAMTHVGTSGWRGDLGWLWAFPLMRR